MFPFISNVISKADEFAALAAPQVAVAGTPSGFFGPAPTAIPNLAMTPQQSSYLYLLNETLHASNARIITLENSISAQIIVTFLSPKLIQAAYLNDFLYRGQTPSEFESRLGLALAKTVQREEILFLVTIIPATYNISSQVVDIQVEEMILMDSSGITIKPGHFEYNLDQPMLTNQDPESGLVGYPMGAQAADGSCAWVLNPVYNSVIVIVTESITVDGSPAGPQTWTIPYEPLILDPNYADPPLDPRVFLKPLPSLLAPLSAPPKVIDDTFWHQYALFVWSKITQGNQ